MATVYKVLGQQNPAATTMTSLYTVPAANSTIVSTINICNLTNVAATFRLAVRPAGATLANTHYLAYDTPIAASDSIALTLGVTLAATDVLAVYSSTASVNFTAFGSEIY